MPADVKLVLNAIVEVFDELNRMNRGEIFDTLEILKNEDTLEEKLISLKEKKLSFQKTLQKILDKEAFNPNNDPPHANALDTLTLFRQSFKIQMAAIQYTEEDRKKAIKRWEKHLFSQKMTVYNLTELEFNKLNPASSLRVDNRFKNVGTALNDLSKDLERIWMGMTSQHICVLVDGKKLYRLNSLSNIFEPTFEPVDISPPGLTQLKDKLTHTNSKIVLEPEQINSCIGHTALSKSIRSERFEWEFKRKEDALSNALLFNFNSRIKGIIPSLDRLGVIYDDFLAYFANIHSDKNKLINLAGIVITLALVSLAMIAITSLFISSPVGWAAAGAILTASTIITATAILSRSINLLGWYLTHDPADNPNKETFLSASSRFRLTPSEEAAYRTNGFSEAQIATVKEALLALAVDMKLFSGSGKKRYHSLFVDKVQGT
ncbi:MAG: hypothetical protein P1U32_08230, partial [Legionellaceae bacterium]|nr:hypothetical protein [Legionellaceae bacterium]